MGQLLRGSTERFNPQIHTESNSLTTKMAKSFAMKRKSFDLFNRYNKFQSWMYYSGRINGGANAGKMKPAKEISDNAFRISYEGMDILPAYTFGKCTLGAIHDAANVAPNMTGLAGTVVYTTVTATTIATNTIGSIAIKHDPANGIYGDKFNPNDSVTLGNGLGIMLLFTGAGRRAATNDHYVYNFKTVGPSVAFNAAHLAVDLVLTESGNFFGEGSMKGYQRTNRNKWRINYSFISRYTLTMTGSAKEQKVAEIYNSDSGKGKKMWEFAEVLRGEKYFRLATEQALRHARSTMNPSTHSWYENYGKNELSVDGFGTESGIDSPIIGDGWIPQIIDNATFDYNPNNALSHTLIEAITNVLATRSPKGQDGNTFLAITDRIGRTAFDRGMKKLLNFDSSLATTGLTNIVKNVATGETLKLGFEITAYKYLGNWFILIEDELFNHPGLYPTSGGLVGTGNIYILNTSVIEGVPNFEVFARTDRNFRKKNVNGMHSFDPAQNNSSEASSGFDGCSIHMLSNLMPVLYDVRSCGVLKATASYAGGALSAHAMAGQKASAFTF